MKAAIRNTYVDYSKIIIADLPIPDVKKEEILVRVYATTINRTDCAIVTGKPYVMRLFTGIFKPRSIFIGTDFAGEIVKVGSHVTKYKVGDRVMGFRDEGINSQAEYMAVDISKPLTSIPTNISYEDAAASLEAVHYAYNWIKNIELTPQHNILINGATGAIGSSLLQFVKNKGCSITAVANTKNMERIKNLGADKVYNYETEDFTNDEGKYDYVFDAVGKSTYGKCKHLLKSKGKYASSELGPYWQNPILAIFMSKKKGKKVVFPVPNKIQDSIDYIKPLLESKTFIPIIERTYPIEKISEAYQYVASGQKTGNVILSMK